MTDILRTFSVDIACDQCGDFSVGLDLIAESQRLLASGCPGSPHECPPALLASLLPKSALESFERAFRDLERAARDPVRAISVEGPSPTATPLGYGVDSRALARWEDDGGLIPAPPPRVPR